MSLNLKDDVFKAVYDSSYAIIASEAKQQVKRYNIYYDKYNILANAYISYIKIVYTDDIYHEIGKMICTSLEKINRITYTEPKISIDRCAELWMEEGYVQVFDDLWRLESRLES